VSRKTVRILYRRGGRTAQINDASLEGVFGKGYEPPNLPDGRTDSRTIFVAGNGEETFKMANRLLQKDVQTARARGQERLND